MGGPDLQAALSEPSMGGNRYELAYATVGTYTLRVSWFRFFGPSRSAGFRARSDPEFRPEQTVWPKSNG
jgi:hypothetical protein